MRYETKTVRVGEYLGPVDWNYDFASSGRADVETRLEAFREMAEGVERGEKWTATTDGGWPRVGWGDVLTVGMYDGWPYWQPTPSFCKAGTLGGEWHSWDSLMEAHRLPPAIRDQQDTGESNG